MLELRELELARLKISSLTGASFSWGIRDARSAQTTDGHVATQPCSKGVYQYVSKESTSSYVRE